MGKKFSSFSLIAFLLLALVQPSSAVDTQVKIDPLFGKKSFGFRFTDGQISLGVSGSALTGYINVPPYIPPGDVVLCKSLSDSKCNSTEITNYNASVLLGTCEETRNQPCIEKLRIFDKENIAHDAVFIRNTTGSGFIGDESRGLPDGKSVTLWKANSFPGEKEYSVTYLIQYGGLKTLTAQDFGIAVQPFKPRSESSARDIEFRESKYPDGRMGVTSTGLVTNVNCAWQEKGICGAEQEFDSDAKVEVTFLVPEKLSGWLHGRLISPTIKVEKLDQGLNRVTVFAKPADVPSASAQVLYQDTTEKMKEIYKKDSHAMAGEFSQANVESAGSGAFIYLDAFEKVLGDRATVKKSNWKIGSIKGVGVNQHPCFNSKNQLQGVVSTNSMIFEDGPPEFKNGFFNYKVGGLHLNPEGSVFKGSYDLSIRSDVARCLYKFSGAPISAEISVIGSDGEKQVATTQVSEANGWINLGAYNFTFSNPSIRVKLVQVSEPLLNVETKPTQNQTSSATKKVLITCVKGKAVSKVTALNPKCPKGYKKK